MAQRKRIQGKYVDPFNPLATFTQNSNSYYQHYFLYLTMLAYQLFEWENLPPSINPAFLEKALITNGHTAFFKDPLLGYIVCKGTASGTLDPYQLPIMYHAHSPQYNKTFPLYNYTDMKKDGMGVMIRNNDLGMGILPSMQMFAQDLAEIKNVIRVNQNAQKTPVIFLSSDKQLLTWKNLAQQIDGNMPYIFADENIDLNNIKTFESKAPFIADKMNQMKNAVWNECMTFLGIKNANLEKKERMVTNEVDSNDEQIKSSGNIMLKSREEACKKINELYGINVTVKFREDLDLSVMDTDTKERGLIGSNNATENDNRTADTK